MDAIWIVSFLLCGVCSCYGSVSEKNADPAQQLHLETLTVDTFSSVKDRAGVQIIYFFKPSGDNRQQTKFLQEYAKSAQVLTAYNVHVGLVECESEHVEQYCSRKKVEDNVFAFRNGHELLSLSLPNMFDIDSIVSNVMQIVLLREVPIIQSPEEREEFEQKHQGKHDIIFSYQVAIGTHAHRILMEVAYAYVSQYKFALSTEPLAVQNMAGYDEKDESAVWLLRCKSAEKDEACKTYKYMGNMQLGDLARFLRVLDLPLVHDVVTDGAFNPFRQNELHSVYMFYDELSKKQVDEYTEGLLNKYMGLIGILHINVNVVDGHQYGLPHGAKIPTIGVLLQGDKSLTFMDLEQPDPYGFVHNELCRVFRHLVPVPLSTRSDRDSHKVRGDVQLDLPEYGSEEAISSDVSDVETEDDQVAAAVNRLRHSPPDTTHIPMLTDKTFPTVTAGSDLVMVMFFVKFDHLSMATLRHYSEASYVLQKQSLTPLAAVNCFDWTDVCAKENITSYPTLMIYRKNTPRKQYHNMLSSRAIVNTIQMLLADSPVDVSSVDQASAFLSGELPTEIDQYTNTAVLGLFAADSQESKAFKEAAAILHGTFVFGLATGSTANTIASKHNCNAPCVVVQKRDDKYEPMTVLQSDFSTTSIVRFAQEKSMPVFPELSASNLPAYLKQHKPLLLLFHEELTSPQHDVLGNMAKSFSQVVLASMQVSGLDGLNRKILQSYRGDSEGVLPVLILVNREAGTVHVYSEDSLDQPAPILQWINAVLKGQRQPDKMLSAREWKPLNPGYDFLEFIRRDEVAKSNPNIDEEEDRRKRIAVANEMGIGFEADGTPSLRRYQTVDAQDVLAAVEDSKEPVDDADVREQLLAMHSSHLRQRGGGAGERGKHEHTEL